MAEEVPNAPIQRCPTCGGALVRTASADLCPRCVAQIAFGERLDPPPDMPESLGMVRRFGDYELLEEIARGGMGVVYRAKQLTLNREVAVKLMLHGALASAGDVERFRAEARNAASLQHPNIINIHEVGEWEGQQYFSMDLVVGQSLDVITRSGPLGSRRAALLLSEVAGAVRHAHERGILHRDLKPSNVIVDAADHAHVTDFGLSRSLAPGSAVTHAGQVLGTPSFMAPEQLAGNSQASGVETDVYGLGALLYQLLTGRPPFTGENLADVLRRVSECEVVPPRLLHPDVPRDIETICLKCLAKDSQSRYRSVQLLGEDLSLFLRGKPIRARPIGLAGRVIRWSRRNPVVASLVGAIAVLLVAVASVSTFAAIRLALDRERESDLAAESTRRLQGGERLIEFMLGDLADKLEPIGRLDLLDATLARIDDFYSKVPTGKLTPESEHNRANLLFQYADIRAIQGHLDESIADFGQAIAAYEALVARHPRNLPWRAELARVRNDLGVSLVQKQNYPQAYTVLSPCLTERQLLSGMDPGNLALLASVGSTANNLAVVCRHLNRPEEAGRMARICEDAYRKCVAAEPANAKAKDRLAVTLGTVGQYYDDAGKLDQAAAYYRERNEILESLLRADPLNSTLQQDRAIGLSQSGDLEGRRSHFDAAVKAYSQGIDALEALVARDATNREWQVYLMNLTEGRGRQRRAAGLPEAALRDFDRVVDFSEKNPEPARTYPEWQKLLRNSLRSGAEIERELAARERASHADDRAADHERAADERLAKLKSLPN